jgi:hypothetical protein
MSTAPVQWRWKRWRNNGKDASGDDTSAMRATTPAQLRQQHQRDKSDNARAMRMLTQAQLQQQHQRKEYKEDAIATTMKTCQRCKQDKGETGLHTSVFSKVLLQLKLHWACDFFPINPTICLAWPNKKIYCDLTQKLTGKKLHK